MIPFTRSSKTAKIIHDVTGQNKGYSLSECVDWAGGVEGWYRSLLQRWRCSVC